LFVCLFTLSSSAFERKEVSRETIEKKKKRKKEKSTKEEKEVSASVRRTDEGPEALKHPVPGYPVQYGYG
jgi:hypothetical protein